MALHRQHLLSPQTQEGWPGATWDTAAMASSLSRENLSLAPATRPAQSPRSRRAGMAPTHAAPQERGPGQGQDPRAQLTLPPPGLTPLPPSTYWEGPLLCTQAGPTC